MATSSISKKAADGLERSRKAAQSALRTVREREKIIQGKTAGAAGAYFGSRFWATRRADEIRTGKSAAFQLGPVTADGTKVGMGMAAIGAMGWLGDDLYDEGIYGTGLGVLAADQAITRYNERLVEPPE